MSSKASKKKISLVDNTLGLMMAGGAVDGK